MLCPLSQEYPPDRRDAFLARLNGLFGGIFSRESWTLSQSYYFGSVNSNPSHRVAVLAGKPIDQAVELDATAIGKPVKPEATTRPAYPAADPSTITDKRVNGKIESLLDNIRAAQDQQKHFTLWDNALAIGGYLHLTDWTDEQAVEKCIAALPSAKDWNLARRTAAEAIAKGRLKPLHLEERPLPPRHTGNGTAPPPPPDAQENRAASSMVKQSPKGPSRKPGANCTGRQPWVTWTSPISPHSTSLSTARSPRPKPPCSVSPPQSSPGWSSGHARRPRLRPRPQRRGRVAKLVEIGVAASPAG